MKYIWWENSFVSQSNVPYVQQPCDFLTKIAFKLTNHRFPSILFPNSAQFLWKNAINRGKSRSPSVRPELTINRQGLYSLHRLEYVNHPKSHIGKLHYTNCELQKYRFCDDFSVSEITSRQIETEKENIGDKLIRTLRKAFSQKTHAAG